MRFARYELDGTLSYGLVEGDRIAPINGSPFGAWQPVRCTPLPLADVRIQVPVIPGNFYAVGLNYPKHIEERARKLGITPELPARPEPGYRSPSALVAHEQVPGAALSNPEPSLIINIK